jgi:hypothetical protein
MANKTIDLAGGLCYSVFMMTFIRHNAYGARAIGAAALTPQDSPLPQE